MERGYINVKKSIFLIVLVLLLGLCAGCGNKKIENVDIPVEQLITQNEDQENTKNSANNENDKKNDFELSDTLEIDYTYDYSEDIKADIECVISGSAS